MREFSCNSDWGFRGALTCDSMPELGSATETSDAAEGTTRDGPVRFFPRPAGSDHRPRSSAGAAGPDDRLELPGGELRYGLRGRSRTSAVADPADGRPDDPEAHA